MEESDQMNPRVEGISGESGWPHSRQEVEIKLKEIVALALGVRRFGADGFSQGLVRCPFPRAHRGDGSAVAQLHLDRGLLCWGCGRRYNWYDTGWEVLGTSLSREIILQASILTTEAREALIKDGMANLARLLDAMRLAGCIPGGLFSREDAVRVCSGLLSPWTVRQALASLSTNICGILSGSCMVIQGEEHHKKPGRPRLLYRLPSLAVLVWCYGLETFHFDEVEAEKLKQLAAYKAEVHAALPRRRPGEYGRTELADRLGVSKPTSRNYDRRAKLRVTPRFDTRKLSSRDIAALPKEGEGVRQYGIWLQDRHGRKYPPLRECAELISGHGGAVYEVRQLKNHYAEGRSSNDGSPTAGSTGPSDGESRDNR